jgi:hypothetical protein
MNRCTTIVIACVMLAANAAAQEPDRQIEAALLAAPVSHDARSLKIRNGLMLFSPQGWSVDSNQAETKQMPGGVIIATATDVVFTHERALCRVNYGNEPVRENPARVLRNMADTMHRIGPDKNYPVAIGYVAFAGREAVYSRVVATNRQAQVLKAYAYRESRLVQVTCGLKQMTPLGANDEPATQDAYRIINGAIWP